MLNVGAITMIHEQPSIATWVRGVHGDELLGQGIVIAAEVKVIWESVGVHQTRDFGLGRWTCLFALVNPLNLLNPLVSPWARD